MTCDPIQFLKCLGDETRLAVVLCLHEAGELCVCDLVTAIDVSQPLMSRHLAQLRQCGVVSARRDGRWMHYRLNDDLPAWAEAVVADLRDSGAAPVARAAVRSHCAA